MMFELRFACWLAAVLAFGAAYHAAARHIEGRIWW